MAYELGVIVLLMKGRQLCIERFTYDFSTYYFLRKKTEQVSYSFAVSEIILNFAALKRKETTTILVIFAS